MSITSNDCSFGSSAVAFDFERSVMKSIKISVHECSGALSDSNSPLRSAQGVLVL